MGKYKDRIGERVKQDLGAFLMEIYRRLYNHFGYRRWWPGESPFEVATGAILTQNTSWKNVERAIARLKEEGLLSPRKFVELTEQELAGIIKSSGFFNQKARRLRTLAEWWLKRVGNSLSPSSLMDTNCDGQRVLLDVLRGELLALKGIGPETADSILLYAFGLPTFVVDAYTIRALRRMGIPISNSYYEVKRLFEENLPSDPALYNDYHAQWVALGKTFCRSQPRCAQCPVQNLCSTGNKSSP